MSSGNKRATAAAACVAFTTAVVAGIRLGEHVVAVGAHLLHERERVRVAEQMVAAQ
jgi:hypothetical protein